MTVRHLSPDDRQRLCRALLEISGVADRDKLDLYVGELEDDLGHQLGAERQKDAQHDLYAILVAAENFPGALSRFVKIIRGFHPNNGAAAEAERLFESFGPPSPWRSDQRAALLRILDDVPAEVVRRALDDAGRPEQRALADDPLGLVRALERLRPGDGPPPLLRFVDVLAHACEATVSRALHGWMTEAGAPEACRTPVPSARRRAIRGDVPMRNPEFTGRDDLLKRLRQMLESGGDSAVSPRSLHGLCGVGKTQLAIEFVYRYRDSYDLIWWISAEQASTALDSLATLCDELGLPHNQDPQQTAETVSRALATTARRWLLIFDNAGDPNDIYPLMPSDGGHVIVTSRNHEWASVGPAIEVAVFERPESVELIRRRRPSISYADADLLADKLGDLPSAVDQAAALQASASMSVADYLDLFDHHLRELLSEGKPPQYPTTVAAVVVLGLERLRSESPAAEQLLELFAYLGPEPISLALLKQGRSARLSQPLGRALRDPLALHRAIRDLRRSGLARIDLDDRIEVHRLVQMVLRQELREDALIRSRRNVHRLLAEANPGTPDNPGAWPFYAEAGPHIEPSGLIDSPDRPARQLALDYSRYLDFVGDYEGTKRFSEKLVDRWRNATGEGLGPTGELTLIATRYLANGIRSLGDTATQRRYDEETYEQLRNDADFGPDHEHTLAAAQNVALGLRIAGEYRRALDIDAESVRRHERVFGADDKLTLLARSNLAVNYRMVGDFKAALRIDEALVRRWQESGGARNARYLICVANMATDFFGLGRYTEALDWQERTYPALREVYGNGHLYVLRAARTVTMSLRKVGRYDEALVNARRNYHDYEVRFNADHEHALASAMTYANTLRVCGELEQARLLAEDTVRRHQRVSGDGHPLRLAALVNLAIILRAVGGVAEAYELDTEAAEGMSRTLGGRHRYTLCAESNLANDLALANRLPEAQERAVRILAASREVRGPGHPYTLACAVNVALGAQELGAAGESDQDTLDEVVSCLAEMLGPDHPEVRDARRFRRAECDIEPPPT